MPLEQGSHRVGLYTVVVLAGVIVIIAGLRAAAGLLVPFLLAGFFGIICSSPLFLMKRKGVPIWLALPIVIIGILMLFGFLGMLLTYSVDQFTSNIEKYNELLRKVVRDLVEWLEIHGIYSRWSTNFDPLNGGNSVSFFTNALQSVAETLSNVLLIILTTAFILLEAAGFERKLQDAFDKPGSHFKRLENFLTGVRRYLGIKTITSLCTGILATFWLWILGVDFAILWGLLAFLLNFIPNIGSFIAGIPPTLLAFLQFGWFEAGLVVLGYFVINTAIGGIIEPRVMGKGVGLSTLVVFISLVFWGWVFGPVGMFLSVPLTMVVKIALDSGEDTRWAGRLLGPADDRFDSSKLDERETG